MKMRLSNLTPSLAGFVVLLAISWQTVFAAPAVASSQTELLERILNRLDRILLHVEQRQEEKRYKEDDRRPFAVSSSKSDSTDAALQKRYPDDDNKPFITEKRVGQALVAEKRYGHDDQRPFATKKEAEDKVIERLAKYLITKQKRDYDIPFPAKK